MGKNKDKSKKSKKHKNKHKKRSRSSDSNSSGDEIVWTENNLEQNLAKVSELNKFVDKTLNVDKHDKEVNDKDDADEIAEEDNWLGLIDKSSRSNRKQSLLNRDILKKESAKADNKVRYARELNSYFRDDVNKKFIDEPDEYWKQKAKSEIEEVDESSEEESDSDLEKDAKFKTPTPVVRKMTDAERNIINSKIIKAELMGDDDLVHELKEKLRKIDEGGGVEDSNKNVEYYAKKVSTNKSKNDQTEDKMSVKEMYLQSKTSISSRDEAMRFVASSSKIRSTDDEYDGAFKKKKPKVRMDTAGGYQRIRSSNEDEACSECIDKIGKHLLLKFLPQLNHCFVCFTQYEPFTSNYCQIRSKSHMSNSTIKCDEECWREIRQVMRLLAAFFDQHFGQSIVFMETYFMYQKKSHCISRKHFVIECVPIKKRLEADARIFFHKAIMECEEEWSMNKKLIKLDGKSVTKMIPNGLPYFWVSFGPNFNGFAHVIEDEDYFRKDFGKEIIGGLRDIEPVRWLKPRFENYDLQLKRMVEVKNKWNTFIDSNNCDDENDK